MATPPDVAIATAYLNAAGFVLVADEGLEPVPQRAAAAGCRTGCSSGSRTGRGLGRKQQEKLDEALTGHAQWIEAERDLMGFTKAETAAARRLVAWLQSTDDSGDPRVQVRRYTDGSLHGKAFIAGTHRLPGVLAGSSNMTYAGLMRNAELNLGYPSGSQGYVALVREWFEGLWEQSEPYPLADVYSRAMGAPHAMDRVPAHAAGVVCRTHWRTTPILEPNSA